MRSISVTTERWPLASPFITSNNAIDYVEVILVQIAERGAVGRGEATGVYFKGETCASMAISIETVRGAVEAGITRVALMNLLPPGGARNAIDCALWELEARLAGRSVASILGIELSHIQTVATISLGTPEAMARQARAFGEFRILKLKLGSDDPVIRTRAVRAARPDARLVIDVNGGWTVRELLAFSQPLASLGVEMIEQPCPPDDDTSFRRSDIPMPLCADESAHTRADLTRLERAYTMINIKLDKSGGLTEALALAQSASSAGFVVMVGNMIGTSLAMAPASLLAKWCRYIDLDGPLLLNTDRPPGMLVVRDTIAPMVPAVWG